MNELEQEVFDQAKALYERLIHKKKLTKREDMGLLAEVTKLLGLYRMDQNPELAKLITNLIELGEREGQVMAGARISFEHLKKDHKVNNST